MSVLGKFFGILLLLTLPICGQSCDHTLRWAPQGAVQSFRNGVMLDDAEIVLAGRQIAPLRFSDQDKMIYVYIREIDNPGQIPPSHYSAPVKETQVCSGTVQANVTSTHGSQSASIVVTPGAWLDGAPDQTTRLWLDWAIPGPWYFWFDFGPYYRVVVNGEDRSDWQYVFGSPGIVLMFAASALNPGDVVQVFQN